MSRRITIQSATRKSRRRVSRHRRLVLELLEDRRLLAGFVVNDAGGGGDYDLDDGACSATFHFEGPEDDPIIVPNDDCTFEAAADNAASSFGPDTITFGIPAGSTVVAFGEIDIGDDTTIDAPAGKIVVSRPSGGVGRGVTAGSGNTIRNLVFTGMVTGIGLDGDNNLVVGNHLGVNLAGTAAASLAVGIRINGNNNTVGGRTAELRNIISGNTSTGVTIGGANNMLIGNYIGTDDSGTQPIGNANIGVDFTPAAAGNNVIGGEGDEGNVISANGIGMLVRGTSGNTIIGNKIGTDVTGTQPLGNDMVGIWINGPNNILGGAGGEGNVISDNEIGVLLQKPGNTVTGNKIGTDVTGTQAMGNTEYGIRINGAANNTIGGAGDAGNVISGNRVGVLIDSSTGTGNFVVGNKIGTDVTGTVRLGNIEAIQIFAAPGNFIGGDPPGGGSGIIGNVISGSLGDFPGGLFGAGVHVIGAGSTGNRIQGNLIGTDITGLVAISNQGDGVAINNASNNTVGGTTDSARNIISGNDGDGVLIGSNLAAGANGNFVEGNYIGVDITGMTALPNGFRGVHIDSNATNNTIGGGSLGARNIISGNESDGVIIALAGATNNVVKENYIGTDKDGTGALGNAGSGIYIFEAPGNFIGQSAGTNFVRNVISANAEHGVMIEGLAATENVVSGNLIGTDKNGAADLPNEMHGVYILNAPQNRIGDVFDGPPSHLSFPGNVIAAKMAGVRIEGADATQNDLLRNLIGVDASGTSVFPTIADVGVHLLDAPNNRIGVPITAGTTAGGNTISHNRRGIHIQGVAATSGTGTIGAIVGGNYIGTDLNGSISGPAANLGNRGEGVLIENFSNSYIGGQPTGSEELPANIIAGNAGDGVRITGTAARGNAIQGNSIFANGLLGIDLGGDGVTASDALDVDVGPNELQNAPFVTPVARSDSSREILGTLSSKPNTLYRIELFSSDVAETSGFGEGQTRVGFLDDVTTDGTGSATFMFDGALVPDGKFATATASDPSGNTSEFSCATRRAIATDGSVYAVTNTNDSGSGSLRDAILEANGHNGLDTIIFCLAGVGTQTIVPESPLPMIINPVIIDGTTQTDASCNTEPESGLNTNLFIELSGANAGTATHGLHIRAGGSTVRGLVINRFGGSGIMLDEGDGNLIECNLIGTDPTGRSALGNLDGVTIQGSSDNLVGGNEPGKWNLISGNSSDGVVIVLPTSEGNRVTGNFIGTDKGGLAGLPNLENGVYLLDAPNNEIGGSADGEGNVISANGLAGVRIQGAQATNNFVRGNLIGTGKDGALPLGNVVAGVYIFEAGGNHVGGQRADEPFVVGNTIAANEHGVHIEGPQAVGNEVLGNHIGTDKTGNVIDPDGNPNNGNGLGNRRAGVFLDNAPSNRIGVGMAEAILPANVIAGNNDGILIRGDGAHSNLVGNNFIGVDGIGKNPLGNRDNGVFIDAARDNVIGGFKPGQPAVPGNTISANGNGALIIGAASTGNVVADNKIGTDRDGKLSQPVSLLGNTGAGIFIQDARENFIGQASGSDVFCDPDTFPANVIGGNRRAGVLVKGDTAQRNAILCNSIFGNAEIGIDLGDDGVTPNDPRDTDGGPNDLQNFPIISILEHVEDNLRIAGTMSGRPQTPYRIDFFATDVSQASALEHGIQGQRRIGTIVVTTDADGYVSFKTGHFELQSISDTEVVTATATDPQNNTSEFSNFTPDFVAGGKEIRTPVIFVPGFFASFVPDTVDDLNYLRFLLRVGLHPDFLALDPILKAYDDTIMTLDNAGYELGQDLFAAPYDWRLPLGPAGSSSERDGFIDGLTADQITDEVFEYGVDYLGYWLRKAAEAWYNKHRQPLTSVHIIAHSMGGVLSRTYIQSSAYAGMFSSSVRTDGGQLALPMVANLTMLGVPNRGAAVTFAPWDDNFAGDPAYRLVLSKVVAHAWHKLRRGTEIVVGRDSTINRKEFDFNAADLHPEKVRFLRRYLPGLGNLLPEYDNFSSNFDPGSLPEFENELLKDLNQSVLSTARTARSIAMYGTSETTHTFVETRQGPITRVTPRNVTIQIPTLGSFTDISLSLPQSSQVWYQDIDADNNGDGTVPLQSLEGLFLDDERAELFPYCKSGGCRTGDIETLGEVGHTKLPSNVDAQLRILRHLGHPIPRGEILTGNSASGLGAVSDFNWYNLTNDPVDALLVDRDGKRWGYTQATGVLAEIPGSVYFGGADGIGWIVGQPVRGPLELQVTGLDDEYLVQVSSQFGSLFQGVEDSGFLGAGETKSLAVLPLVVGPAGETELLVSGEGEVLDLTEVAAGQMEVIDAVRLDGDNTILVLDPPAVHAAAGGTGVLRVRSQLDDVVEFGAGWSLAGVTVDEGVFYRVLEQDVAPLGTAHLLLNGPADWQNPINRLDVNANDSVEAADVLVIFNELNRPRYRNSAGLLVDAASLQLFPNFYFDVNSDGFVVPLDALIIINFINSLFGVTEGENPSASAVGQFDGMHFDPIQIAVRSESRPSVSQAVSHHEPTAAIARGVAPTVPQSPPTLRQLTRPEYIRGLDELLAELRADAWQDELLP